MKYKDLISKMTLDEKASFLSGKDFWQTMDSKKFDIPSIFLADGPHGLRKQVVAADHLGLNESLKATCFPTAAAMANSFNTELGKELGRCLGEEAVYQKVNVLLGPGVNMKRNPLCGRNFEYFSEDPYLAGKMGTAYIQGIQSNGIAACVKHFAVNNQEERRMVIDTVVDERTLREIYLTAFEMAVKEGKVKTVMSSYNKINGEYANENKHLLKEILRDDWGFNGVIVTDWGGSNDRIEALKAGNELEMPTTGGETNQDIVKAVNEGRIDESVVDENLDRLLTLIFDTGAVLEKEKKPIDMCAHQETARRAAEDSIVLLKNEGNLLPLKKGFKVAVIGDFAKTPRYQGAGSSVVNPTKIENTLEVIKDYGDLNYIGYSPGFKRFGKKSKGLIKKAVRLANRADVVLLYIGLDEATETEGMDRKSMKLPANQIELIAALKKTGKKIIAILSCGAAVETHWANSVQALVHGYLGGQEGAAAMLNVLTGRVNPSGKLAESYPCFYVQSPNTNYFPGKQATVEYRESLYIGYRYYDTAGIKVMYPFGYGLSYTTFEYSNIKAVENGVSFILKNMGEVAGAEVAQLYVCAKNGTVFRPKKELKGFKKVRLEPNESKAVEIPFDEYTFRYFNVLTNKWEIEPCEYVIMVGSSSQDIKLTIAVIPEGTAAKLPYSKEQLPSYYSGKVDNVGLKEFENLYGRIVPNPDYNFVKKNRINIDYNTAVSQLRYARGWTGRLFASALRFADWFLRLTGNFRLANVLMMGIFHMPLRGFSRMTGGMINYRQLDGLIYMFNGHFFAGLHRFFAAGRQKRKLRKKGGIVKKRSKQHGGF